MSFQWLKPYMPRGLYGRAALILVLPVVVVQLVVSVVFIQRHFEDVSIQMTREVAREIRLLMAQPPGPAREAMAEALEFSLAPAAPEPVDGALVWYDLTAPIVRRALYDALPGLVAVALPDTSQAILTLRPEEGGQAAVEITLRRARLSARNPHQLFVNMVFFGGLMTLIAFIYLRNQLRPITRLAKAAQAFGRGRHVEYHPSGAQEVRAAGNAFLDMRARIERQIEQRTLMLSGVSHDLRTPLTRLKLGLSFLDDDEREPLERDVEDMQRMIDEFLSFAKGIAEGEAEPTDPISLVRDLVDDHRRNGAPVTLIAAEGQGEVALRPVALRRAVDNLVSNAVRYGDRAEVSVTLSDKSLRIRVEDDGPGIPADQRGDAIRPFTRLDSARNQNRGSGVGLGLAIAADIARAHGGVLRLGVSDRLGGLRADIVIAR
ncbi:ATP-binding protein [Lutimaribacter sp. EGI FJ00015]|uniref:ATP-binding protein n=1 Tax=Lutimaribacter degradans TaxID=2945989 RepID=A0ACC5ZT75_9RHOB|nr:ATP-binding protein [Lutimaribacter sp. EGI FJ00013]MCM2561345.1 ATP-binding protein [Lutimaribacter sp. EGI FJ00013]MCO0611704.1 ATP-binding protein [Lutimaribacter sp. EGI FJ00015]MCO0635174.1 ATP-binding protein [Lutimaribacter sp. EGI FJ00014]